MFVLPNNPIYMSFVVNTWVRFTFMLLLLLRGNSLEIINIRKFFKICFLRAICIIKIYKINFCQVSFKIFKKLND